MHYPEFRKKGPYVYEAEPIGRMNVPARVLADDKLWRLIQSDESLKQLCNVTMLPGILGYAIAMPDIHAGYGFPIGGVAVFRKEDGVISPGGVGYDINCGVRVLTTQLTEDEIRPKLQRVVDELFRKVPAGVGSSGAIRKLSKREMEEVVIKGAGWAVEQGYIRSADLNYMEENGCLKGADPGVISHRAYERGRQQLGTLGSGNHFVEVDVVDHVENPRVANKLGLFKNQIVIQIHCGSRGFGHQICEDYLSVMHRAVRKYGIYLPDRQLVCSPLSSPEADQYLKAMRGAANFAWANRSIIQSLVVKALEIALSATTGDIGLRILYDVCHNIAKFEDHIIHGKKVTVCVHRKGATRAFGPGSKYIPEAYREVGQPVLIPGDMGRYSFILVGTEKAMRVTFGSSCHGAGRVMSRRQAKRQARSRNIEKELEKKGIIVRGASRATISEEMPEAYKDVADVVRVIHKAKVSGIVVRLRPIGVVKG